MAAPLTWAGGPKPTSESWWIENTDRSGGPGINGSEQIISSPGGRWRGRLAFQCIREDVLWMRALVMGLRGRAGLLRVGPFDQIGAPQPGTQDRWALELDVIDPRQLAIPTEPTATASLVGAYELMDTEVVIRMQGGRSPAAGIYAQIGGNLHGLTNVAPVPGSLTDFRCGIEPWLRDDMASGTAVQFDDPTCVMRCMTPVSDMTVQGGSHLTNITLDLVEAF